MVLRAGYVNDSVTFLHFFCCSSLEHRYRPFRLPRTNQSLCELTRLDRKASYLATFVTWHYFVMSSEDEQTLSTKRKRRGVVRASLTRLDMRVAELEGRVDISMGDRLAAQQLLLKLDTLDADFKLYHFAIVDLVDDELLEMEQGVLNEHDDRVADLALRIQQLYSESTPSSPSTSSLDPRVRLTKRLRRLDRDLELVTSAVESIGPGSVVDVPLLSQYQEQLSGIKAELVSISNETLSLDSDDEGLSERETKLSKIVFDVSLKIKRLLQPQSSASPTPDGEGGLKLPKLDVPTFDGNIINW